MSETRNDTVMRISGEIAKFQDRSGKTNADMAAEMDITAETFGRKRKGAADWSLTEMCGLADIIDIPLGTLVS